MPILGLFNSPLEQQRRREASQVAGGHSLSAESNAANVATQQSVAQARKGAFAQAYQSRGNPALAQRQAQEAASNATMQGGQQIALQRAGDVSRARGQLDAMDAERNAGINSAIGFGAQALGTVFGGPAAGAAAGGVANALTSQLNPTAQPGAAPPAQAVPGGQFSAPLFGQQSAPGQPVSKAAPGGLGIVEDAAGAMGTLTAPGATAPATAAIAAPRLSQVNPDFVAPPAQQPLTQPLPPPAAPPAAGLEALYSRMGNQRDPSTDLAYRRRFGQQYWGQQ